MRLLRPVYLVAPYSLECLFGVYFNAINIRCCVISPTSCTPHIAVSLGSCFLLFPTFSDITFPPICATSCCGLPFCVFSLSEMLNALLISSFYDWFQQFPVLFDWFQQFPVLFDWFQHFPVLFDWFQHYPVFLPGSAFSLSFSSGPFLQEVYLLYMQYFFCLFSLYLCDLLCNFVPF